MTLRSDNVYDLIGKLEQRIIELEKSRDEKAREIAEIKESIANALGDTRPQALHSEPDPLHALKGGPKGGHQWNKSVY